VIIEEMRSHLSHEEPARSCGEKRERGTAIISSPRSEIAERIRKKAACRYYWLPSHPKNKKNRKK